MDRRIEGNALLEGRAPSRRSSRRGLKGEERRGAEQEEMGKPFVGRSEEREKEEHSCSSGDSGLMGRERGILHRRGRDDAGSEGRERGC